MTTDENNTTNSGQDVAKTATAEQSVTPPPKLTAEEIKFTHLVASGMTYTSAYRKSHPLKAKNSYEYIRKLAYKLAARTEVQSEVEAVKDTRARLARMAEDRLEQIL